MADTNTNTNNNNIKPTEPNLQSIMKKIETDVNPKTMQEGIALLNNPDALVGRLQAGADMFKEQTGRNMTYLEMRQMFG
jgi:peptide subunit release factor RF-3